MKRGRRKQITDEQIAKLKAWKRSDGPLFRLAMELGMSRDHASAIRTGFYTHTPRGASRKRTDQPHAGHQVVLGKPSASVLVPVADPTLTSADTGSACRVAPRYSESVTPGVGCSPAGGWRSESRA